MKDKEKLEMIEEMLDLDEGTLLPEQVLTDLEEWDSIAVISLIALMDEEYNKQIKGSDIKQLQTVADVLALMVD